MTYPGGNMKERPLENVYCPEKGFKGMFRIMHFPSYTIQTAEGILRIGS